MGRTIPAFQMVISEEIAHAIRTFGKKLPKREKLLMLETLQLCDKNSQACSAAVKLVPMRSMMLAIILEREKQFQKMFETLGRVNLAAEEEIKKSTTPAYSTLFLLTNEEADKETEKLGPASKKLLNEVKSWRSFAQALRIEDRRLLNRMLENIWSFDGVVESCKEGYETEAFLLGLLVLQQKTIDHLEKIITEKKADG